MAYRTLIICQTPNTKPVFTATITSHSTPQFQSEFMLQRPQLRAELFLALATLGWGMNYPLMKMALQLESGIWVLAARFSLSFVVMLPFLWLYRRYINAKSIKIGIVLGLIILPSVELMNWGLHYTSSANAGFIFALCIIWVPILNAYLNKTRISRQIKLSMTLGLIGLMVIANVFQLQVNFGDGLILICSFLYAIYVLVLDRYGQECSGMVMTVTQLGVLSLGCTVFYLLTKPEIHIINWSWSLVLIILASCLVSSTFATWAQTRYQADTTPDRATLIFNLEPIFATLFAAWWLNEKIGWNIIIGGSFILAAILLPTLAKRWFDNRPHQPSP